MPKRWPIKPKRAFRENARVVVPLMVDEFLSHRNKVISHPRLKRDLHRMRLAGKTLRYAMEVFESGFQAGFSSKLEELKQILDTMGRIHDCDVHIPRMQLYLKEIRLFNRACDHVQDRVPTSALIRVIREQSALRLTLFAEMTLTLERWEQDNFKTALVKSMEPETAGKD